MLYSGLIQDTYIRLHFAIKHYFKKELCRVSHRFSDTINSRMRLRSSCNTEADIFSVKLYKPW